jgi:hypothetical protein
MTRFTHTIFAFAIVAASAVPAAAGQSANRTGSGPANPPKAVAVTVTAPESQAGSKCQHCASGGGASHQAHQSVAENQTRQPSCCAPSK